MSHFIQVRSSMTDLEVIRRALKRMGLEVVGENTKVDQYGQQAEVALLLDKGDNKQGAVGLALQKDGTYSIAGDCYHATNRKLKSFYGKDKQLVDQLETAYAVEKATSRCEELGFYIEENSEAQVGEDGMIRMVAVSYAS